LKEHAKWLLAVVAEQPHLTLQPDDTFAPDGFGTLLAAMSDRWTRHGIEPGASAVATAQQRGFDVRQGTAQELGLHEVADVALLVDVIEHMLDPEAELQAIVRMLRPGGTLAVFTGRADAITPRLSGRLWYYLHVVGHVTIFSGDALCGLMRRVGLAQ
jgi:SAM-dependent methyltransferase